MRLRPELNFTVTVLIAFGLAFTGGLGLAVLGFRGAGQEAAMATADASLAQVAATIAARTNALMAPGIALINGFTQIPDAPEIVLPALLQAERQAQAAAFARPDGSLVQAAVPEAVAAELLPKPPEGTALVLRRTAPDGQATWSFLAADGHVLGSADAGHADPAGGQQWVLQARVPGVHVSTLYLLDLARRPGLSISRALPDGSVLALDMTLASLGNFLRAQQVTPHTRALLFSDLGIVLAAADDTPALSGDAAHLSWTTLQASHDPMLRALWDAYATAQLAPGGGVLLAADGAQVLARLEGVATLPDPPVLVGVLAPRADFTAPVQAAVRAGTRDALLAFAVGLALIALLAWRVAHPLGVLTREAMVIRELDLAKPLRLRSHITEVEHLAAAMAAMKATLGSFAAYLPRDLVRHYLAAGLEPVLGGERVALSVMFTDVQGFTSISETLDPMLLTQIASVYFEAVTRELLDCGATIDKFIGDSVMAFWNAPRADAAHAAHACHAALRARAVTLRLATEFPQRGWPPLPTRFGVHTGEAVVGNIGSADRMAYTAMGAMVNLANRLEGLNKFYATAILVSAATRHAAGPGFLFRPADIVIVKGSEQPVAIFELVGVLDAAAPPELRAPAADIACAEAWEACVTAWRRGDFAAARRLLTGVRAAHDFPLAQLYAARLATPGEAAIPGWDPAQRLTEK